MYTFMYYDECAIVDEVKRAETWEHLILWITSGTQEVAELKLIFKFNILVLQKVVKD